MNKLFNDCSIMNMTHTAVFVLMKFAKFSFYHPFSLMNARAVVDPRALSGTLRPSTHALVSEGWHSFFTPFILIAASYVHTLNARTHVPFLEAITYGFMTGGFNMARELAAYILSY